jgi:hypothetical protein
MVFCPGLIVMEADNDAGAVSTYTKAGAQYGLHLLWVLLSLLSVCDFALEAIMIAASRLMPDSQAFPAWLSSKFLERRAAILDRELPYGKLKRSTTWLAVLAVAPVSLITCSMVPTPPRETVTRSWNWTPEVSGTSKA